MTDQQPISTAAAFAAQHGGQGLPSEAAVALYDKLSALLGEIDQEPDAQEGLWAEMVAVLRDADPHAIVALIFRGPPPRAFASLTRTITLPKEAT